LQRRNSGRPADGRWQGDPIHIAQQERHKHKQRNHNGENDTGRQWIPPYQAAPVSQSFPQTQDSIVHRPRSNIEAVAHFTTPAVINSVS
jgi:hypothetical protein